jgi:hypothetical protein
MDKTLKKVIINVVLPLALVLTFLTIGAQAAPSIPPILIPQNTTYQEGSGGIASDTCPNAILHVAVITIGDTTVSNVVVDVSQVNTTGQLSMVQDGTTIIGDRTAIVYSAGVFVDKAIRPGGAKYLPVVAIDSTGNTGTTDLVIIAFYRMGVTVIGYNPSKAIPAIPSNVSFFYDHSPVKIIVTSIDGTHYTNVTATFSAIDGSTSVEYDNSGVLLPDGNYSYEITHTLGTIPGTFNVNMSWINVTFNVNTRSGTSTIYVPQIGAFVVLGNFNPKDDPSSGLGGDTTDWRTIPDYSAAYLVFEPVDSLAGKIATLQFTEPIDLTDYETAMQLKNLGEMLTISKKSMDLNASANALSAFNKASNLTIYNLTAFTVDPGILEDGLLVPSSGGVITNYNWNNSTKTLSFSVGHWTAYSWDGELPLLSLIAVDYPTGQTAVKSGQSVNLHAVVTDSYSGVKNVTVDATSIGSGFRIFSSATDNVWSNTTVVSAPDGNYTLTVVAYDKAANRNTGIITVSVNNNATPTSANSTIGIFRTGNFFLASSNIPGGGPVTSFNFGQADDVPVAGDWNADGKTEVGIFRTGNFFLASSNIPGGGTVTSFNFGQADDEPVAGKWSGNGAATVGIFRSGNFFLASSNIPGGGTVTSFNFGQANDIPVAGDWDGDGKTTVGIFRSGNFYLASSNIPGGGTVTSFNFGMTDDVPVTGDWNADGKTEVGVFRNGVVYLASSNIPGGGTVTSFTFGMTGDVPVAGKWT